MKKRFFLLLLILCILPVVNSFVFAESEPVIFGDVIDCKPGDTIRYSVNIKSNPGVAGFLISVWTKDDWIYFDENIEAGSFSDKGTYSLSYEPQRINVLWFNADDVKEDGSLFELRVHVSPSAPDGEYPIGISVSDKNTINDKFSPVSVLTEEGLISVSNVEPIDSEEVEIGSPITKSFSFDNKVGWIAASLAVCVFALVLVLAFRKKK